MDAGSVVVVGGTSGTGREIARLFAERGREVVLSGRDAQRARAVAAEIGGRTLGVGFDLAEPEEIATGLRGVGPVDHLVLAAIERDENTARDYDVKRAIRLATLKLVGYTEVVHALVPRMGSESSVVMFGGLAKDRPYPGSTTVATVNGGIATLVHALAVELAPIRVNAVHPAIVGDSPYWAHKPAAVLEGFRSRTPTGRLVAMRDVVGAVVFLLENRSMNGANLPVDAGRLLWVDLLACEVHRLDPGSGEDSVLRTQQHVGAAKPRARGGLVVNLRDGVGLYDPDGGFRWLASLAVQGCRGNDAAVDAAGHLWAGTMPYDETPGGGRLYRVGPGGEVVTVLDGVTVSNGIGWSPGGLLMYYVDTPTRRVDVLDVDLGTGLVARRRPFVDLDGVAGFPDGLTVDAD